MHNPTGKEVFGMNDDKYCTGLTLSFPADGFDEAALARLRKLLDARGALIGKALHTDRLDVCVGDGTVSFPWWDALPESEAVQAYSAFAFALCALAKRTSRVNAKVKQIESEKYAFRTLLLRMGFVGAQYKAFRRTLLRDLSGSAAFPNQARADAFYRAHAKKSNANKSNTCADT